MNACVRRGMRQVERRTVKDEPRRAQSVGADECPQARSPSWSGVFDAAARTWDVGAFRNYGPQSEPRETTSPVNQKAPRQPHQRKIGVTSGAPPPRLEIRRWPRQDRASLMFRQGLHHGSRPLERWAPRQPSGARRRSSTGRQEQRHRGDRPTDTTVRPGAGRHGPESGPKRIGACRRSRRR